MKKKELTRLIKTHLGDFSHQYGFYLYEGDILYKIKDYVFQGIYFQISEWSDSITLEIFVMPLFKRHEYITFTIGHRIGSLMGTGDHWWEIGRDEESRRGVFEEIRNVIQQYGIPWLQLHETARKILDVEEKNVNQNYRLSVVYSYHLAYCALWEKDLDLAMRYLKLHDDWFEKSDDRRDWVVKEAKIVKEFIQMAEAKEFQKIEQILKDNIAFSIQALQIEKKTKSLGE